MDFFNTNILSIVTFWPLAGMFVLLLIHKENNDADQAGGRTSLRSAGFCISLPLWFWFDFDDRQDAVSGEMRHGSSPWASNYHVGIDGISLLLVMLTTLIGPLAVLSSWDAIQIRMKEYYAFMLMLQAGMLGVFISLDFFLFYVFWEVMLVPMYFLIGVWGGPRKLYAAIKFFLYTLVGSVLMLLGILALYFQYPDDRRGSIPRYRLQFGTAADVQCAGVPCDRPVSACRTFSTGSSWRSSSDSRSRSRCSRSIPGFPMLTWKRRRQVRSSWPPFC